MAQPSAFELGWLRYTCASNAERIRDQLFIHKDLPDAARYVLEQIAEDLATSSDRAKEDERQVFGEVA